MMDHANFYDPELRRHTRLLLAFDDSVADTADRCLRPGLVDDIVIRIVPVLLGGGTRLFDRLGKEIKRTPTGTTASLAATTSASV